MSCIFVRSETFQTTLEHDIEMHYLQIRKLSNLTAMLRMQNAHQFTKITYATAKIPVSPSGTFRPVIFPPFGAITETEANWCDETKEGKNPNTNDATSNFLAGGVAALRGGQLPRVQGGTRSGMTMTIGTSPGRERERGSPAWIKQCTTSHEVTNFGVDVCAALIMWKKGRH